MNTIVVKGKEGNLRVCVFAGDVTSEEGRHYTRASLAGGRKEKTSVRIGDVLISITGMHTRVDFQNYDAGHEMVVGEGWTCDCPALDLAKAPVVEGVGFLNDLVFRFAPSSQKAA